MYVIGFNEIVNFCGSGLFNNLFLDYRSYSFI